MFCFLFIHFITIYFTELNLIKKYENNIEHIFLGIPELYNQFSIAKQYSFSSDSSHELLKKTKHKYKRIVVYNNTCYDKSDDEVFKYFEDTIYPLIEEYQIDGFTITSLPLAQKIRKDYPNIELHTSVNCNHFTIRTMDMWRELAGIDIFNAPREAGRMIPLLKEMKEHGFKTKILVNEPCVFGCPFSLKHQIDLALQRNTKYDLCYSYDYINAFKTNLILPKWLDYLDEYVYCYKISGRVALQDNLLNYLDAYILGKKFTYINDYACYGDNNPIGLLEKNFGIKIREEDIPDKLIQCECKECNRTCFICSNLYEKYIKDFI